jgi:hypothetical protein
LLDVAMAWHVEAAGSNGFPGTGDPRTFEAANRAYQRVLASFSRAQIDAYGSTDSEPGFARVMRATGDLAYAERRWLDCARSFGAAEQANQGGQRAGDELLFAAVCWQRALDERLQARENERGLGRAVFDAGTDAALLAALDRYECRAAAAADDLEAAAAQTTVLGARDKLRRLTLGVAPKGKNRTARE